MNRKEALDFIINNSRSIRSFHLNPVSKAEKDADYEANYFEHRIGNNGTTFCLLDMGKHGWDLYFPVGSNEISPTIEMFCKLTGATTDNLIKL